MKHIFFTLFLVPSVFASTTVKCFERNRDAKLELTTIVTKNKLGWKYKRLSNGEVYEKGLLKKEMEGSGDEFSLCLNKRGDSTWFSFCMDDQIVMIESEHGRLMQMYGIREYDLGIELLCEAHILKLL